MRAAVTMEVARNAMVSTTISSAASVSTSVSPLWERSFFLMPNASYRCITLYPSQVTSVYV